ncbi:hypothetical protein B0H11DRAFT_1900385 [Mycena galericulata]|nr:hypothetical protein B0H11DRAFT_1900385 [Mycena galericulata]
MSLVDRFDHDVVSAMRQSSELSIYSCQLNVVVEAAWPMVDGVKLTPRQLVQFLQKEGLHFPCFCNRILGVPFGCEFTLTESSNSAQVYAYCHFDPPRCGFFIDLLRVYRESTQVHQYPSNGLIHNPPYSRGLLDAYLFQARPDNSRLLPGFLGDVNYIHIPGENLTAICTLQWMPQLQEGQLGPKHCRPPKKKKVAQRKTVASQTDVLTICDLSSAECNAVEALSAGNGLTKDEEDVAFEHCIKCRRLFMARFLPDHARKCTYRSVRRATM